MNKQIESFNSKANYFSGVNNQTVINVINKPSVRNLKYLMATYCLVPLNKNIPHNKLENVMRRLINSV